MPEALRIRLSGSPGSVRLVKGLSRLEPASEPGKGRKGSVNDLDRIMEAARQGGYEEGAGEWGGRFAQAVRTLESESAKLRACRAEFLSSLERCAVELGLAVAEKFLIGERDRRHYAIRDIVHSVLEKLEEEGGRLQISLNPEDLAAFSALQPRLDCAAFESIRMSADPAVPLAGCRVDTGRGRVVFSLEDQMSEIRRLLTELETMEDEASDVEHQSPQEVA